MDKRKTPLRPQPIQLKKDQQVHRGTVLVVDDERAVADSLAFMLRHEGYKAQVAYSFEEATKEMSRIQPDLVIADVLLPDGNGIELAVRLRKERPLCRVLLFSGGVESHSLVSNARAEGHDFLFVEKPIHPQDLLSKLRML
jgi:DNA-binding response OmpR family regulator